MSSAARQRLRRSRLSDQLTFGGELDATLFPVAAPPNDDEAAQHQFAELADSVRARFVPRDDPWATSPYLWVKQLPPASRGRAGTALVEQWATACGWSATPRREHGHNLTIGSDRVEVKVSTLWAANEYTFQSVRDDGYDLLALLGISPHAVHLWLVPRRLALTHVDRPGWITVPVGRTPAWLTGHGGGLRAARDVGQALWGANRTPTPTGPTLQQ